MLLSTPTPTTTVISWPASHAAAALLRPPASIMRDMEVSSKQWRGKEPLWTPPSTAPLGCDRQAVCRTHWEITTHLLWLSARVSDEQRRPLADANCRGVEVGVWVGVRGVCRGKGGVHR